MQAVLVFLLFSLFSTFSFAQESERNPLVEEKQKLVIGRQIDHFNYLWTPKQVGEENSTFQDLVGRFADKHGYDTEYRFFANRDEMLTALYYGDLDMVLGYATTDYAEDYFNFTTPIFNIRSVIWYQDSGKRKQNAESLRWGCVRGSFYCFMYEKQGFENISIFDSERILLRSIAKGEIDALYTDVITAEQYLSVRTPGEWQGNIDYLAELPPLPAAIATAKNNTELHKLADKYVALSRASLRRNQRTLVDPIAEEMMLKALALHYGRTTIRYSFEEKMRPFSYLENGNQVGYIHDLMAVLSRKSGIQFVYVPPEDKSPIEMLRDGDIDLLPGFAQDKNKDFIFTNSFASINWKCVESNTKSGSGEIAILDRTGRLVMGEAQRVFDVIPTIYQDLDELLDDMKDGDVDYAYIPSYVVDYYAYNTEDELFSVLQSPQAKRLSIDLVFTFAPESSLLQGIMNQVITQVSENEVEMLHLKHHKVIVQYGYNKNKIALALLSVLSVFLLIIIAFQIKANRLSKSLVRADEQAKQNARRMVWLRDLLDRLPSMVAIYDTDGSIVMSNKAFNQHGMQCSNFQRGNCLLKNETYQFGNSDHLVCQCSFSKRYLRVIENEISGLNDDGRYRMMVFDDYTALETQKDELKASNEKALKAIKSRDLFLATVSHELRTPIAAMIGLMELMSSKTEGDENVELLTNAQLSANRLRLLVNDILDISKIEANQLHLDIRNGNIYSELAPLLRTYESNAAMKGLEFELDWQATPYAKAELDWLRVAQMLNNLLNNAVKFTQQGSIKVSIKLLEQQLLVTVSDTGCGMNDEQLSRIFTPFAQGDISITRQYGGTGLGMTIVKSIVDMMSGELRINSKLGIGTTIELLLPVSQTTAFIGSEYQAHSNDAVTLDWLKVWSVQTDVSYPIIELASGWKNVYPDVILDALKYQKDEVNDLEIEQVRFIGNILVADDDPINRLLFSKQLAKFGIEAVVRNDGLEAYQYLEEHFGEIDLVITDCHMPKMDGYALCSAIKQSKQLGHLPVVGCTAEDSRLVFEKAASVGMDHVLYKPYSFEELGEMLREHIEFESVASKNVISRHMTDLTWLDDHQGDERAEMMRVVVDSFKQEKALIEDGEQLAQVIHRLKGSASLLQLEGLTALAIAWEESTQLGNEASPDLLLGELSRLLAVFDEWLLVN
ncbi:ATP-binding protein [Vibrio fluminensis]|uniref:ATP-binding protein n=1 Tax=Vibrio fluminensis TaxID=2783614 RepID=UPI0018891180|nr:ATP-binding protein [Vibrio fluminensis]